MPPIHTTEPTPRADGSSAGLAGSVDVVIRLLRAGSPPRALGWAASRSGRAYRTAVTADRRLFLGLFTGRGVVTAAADQALDVQILQTAASIENVLVSTYDTLLGLPLFTGPTANTLLRDMLSTARGQHAEHATACNELATRLGGRAQTGPNAALAQTVTRARSAGLGELGAAVDLALQLETASSHTYVLDIGLLSDLNARRLAGQILGVESEHVGVLRVAQALLAARMPELISHDSGVPERLPPEAAKAGFPDAMSTVDLARPAADGAIS